jgi:hypothetical protein
MMAERQKGHKNDFANGVEKQQICSGVFPELFFHVLRLREAADRRHKAIKTIGKRLCHIPGQQG